MPTSTGGIGSEMTADPPGARRIVDEAAPRWPMASGAMHVTSCSKAAVLRRRRRKRKVPAMGLLSGRMEAELTSTPPGVLPPDEMPGKSAHVAAAAKRTVKNSSRVESASLFPNLLSMVDKYSIKKRPGLRFRGAGTGNLTPEAPARPCCGRRMKNGHRPSW